MRRIELCEKSCAGSTDDQPEVCRCEPDCELDANMRLFFNVDSPTFNHAFCPKCDKKEVKKND